MRAILAGATALYISAGASAPAAAEIKLSVRTVEIAGVTLSCSDFRGRVVQTYLVSGLGDAGRSIIMGRVPIISLDKEVMATLSGKLQIFFYLHECAHHTLAHMFYPSPEAEQEADCWSIRTARNQSYINRADVESFGPRLAASPGTKRGHLPGPERVAHLLKCFDN